MISNSIGTGSPDYKHVIHINNTTVSWSWYYHNFSVSPQYVNCGQGTQQGVLWHSSTPLPTFIEEKLFV